MALSLCYPLSPFRHEEDVSHFPAPEDGRKRLCPLAQGIKNLVGLHICFVLKDKGHGKGRIEDEVHGRPSLIRSLILSFSFPGGLSTLREAFICAMTS